MGATPPVCYAHVIWGGFSGSIPVSGHFGHSLGVSLAYEIYRPFSVRCVWGFAGFICFIYCCRYFILLQLCDYTAGRGSVWCAPSGNGCAGATNSWCHASHLWSGYVSSGSPYYSGTLIGGAFGEESHGPEIAFSVRSFLLAFSYGVSACGS